MDPSKSLPKDCHVGGYEESEYYKGPVYIGRKRIGNEVVIGKVIDSWKSGYCKSWLIKLSNRILSNWVLVPKDGGEHWSDTYEVLCGGNGFWVPKDGVHKNLVIGGQAGNPEPFYVCRGHVNDQTIPGKFYKPTRCCYVGSYGKEYCAQDYSLMTNCCDDNKSKNTL